MNPPLVVFGGGGWLHDKACWLIAYISRHTYVSTYISSCHMLIDKALSSDKPNGHWFEADWLHCKRDPLSGNRKVDGSRLTGSTQACHS